MITRSLFRFMFYRGHGEEILNFFLLMIIFFTKTQNKLIFSFFLRDFLTHENGVNLFKSANNQFPLLLDIFFYKIT